METLKELIVKYKQLKKGYLLTLKHDRKNNKRRI